MAALVHGHREGFTAVVPQVLVVPGKIIGDLNRPLRTGEALIDYFETRGKRINERDIMAESRVECIECYENLCSEPNLPVSVGKPSDIAGIVDARVGPPHDEACVERRQNALLWRIGNADAVVHSTCTEL